MNSPDFGPPLMTFGSRVRKSPYFEATRRYGCNVYTIYNHTYMPVQYEDPIEAYWQLVKHVTVWDVACERQVEVTGPDAYTFVKTLTPRNLTKMAVGQAKYVPIVDENGGIINDPVMLRLGENHFWFSLADSDVLLWAKGVAVGCGLDVTLGEPDVSPLQIQGPKSSYVVRNLFGDWVLDLKYFWFKETELDGIPLILARTGWSNERGYELFLRDRKYGVKLWDMVMAAGKPYNISPGTPSQIKRIEAGLLSYGNDMTLENNPYEIGLGKFVNLKQEAEFIGKAALKRIKAEGIKRKLVGVELHAEQPLPVNEHHWPVRHNDDAAGTLTSSAWSPSLEMNIAYVMTPIEYAEIGTKLTVETPWQDVHATVCPLPFVDNRARGKSK